MNASYKRIKRAFHNLGARASNRLIKNVYTRLRELGYSPNEISVEMAELEASHVLAQEERCGDIFAIAQVALKF